MLGARRGARGFTLTGLMIAVAVVSLLTGVAAPFYFRFQAHAARAEVARELMAIAAAEKAYFSEHRRYTDDLRELGWQPQGAPRYLFGFTSDAQPTPSGRNDTSELAGAFSTRNMVDAYGLALSAADLPDARVSPQTFVVGAVGNLDNDATLDRWTLDDGGNLQLVTSDSKH